MSDVSCWCPGWPKRPAGTVHGCAVLDAPNSYNSNPPCIDGERVIYAGKITAVLDENTPPMFGWAVCENPERPIEWGAYYHLSWYDGGEPCRGCAIAASARARMDFDLEFEAKVIAGEIR